MTTTDVSERQDMAVLDGIRGTRDALSVQRVFGDPCTADGVTMIPVARIAGGAGGGGGEGTGQGDEGGHGFGTGFGLGAHPVGAYELRDGRLRWRPAIDVNRLARGVLAFATLATVGATLVRLRRRPAATAA